VRRGYEGAKFKFSAKIFLSIMRGGAFYGFLALLGDRDASFGDRVVIERM
jgi:hypothetical protein